jgi:hypothetical protein
MNQNIFLTNPPRISVVNPATGKDKRTYICVGGVPKNILTALQKSKIDPAVKSYYGPNWKQLLGLSDKSGGDDLDDIEALLMDETPTESREIKNSRGIAVSINSGMEYYSDVHFYPEDRLSEMKEKIYIMTGIPTYRQHVYWISGDQTRGTYNLYHEGLYPIDIRELWDSNVTGDDQLHGLPIDRELYDGRALVKVEALDSFTTMGSLPAEIRVVDLDYYISKIRSVISQIVKDSYQAEMLYYGFVIKYWPSMVYDVFYDYIENEYDLKNKYPDLARNRASLISAFRLEREIIDWNYHNTARIRALSEGRQVSVSITSAMLYVDNAKTLIDTRNLFDSLRVSPAVPEIHARFSHEGKNYLARKRYIRSTGEILFPTAAVMKNGVVVAIAFSERRRYLFLNIQPSGRYYVKVNWDEEDEYQFSRTVETIKSIIDPIIKGINNLSRTVFIAGNKLVELTADNVVYQGLNVCVYWKKVMGEAAYKAVRAHWDTYMKAQLAAPRNVQQFDKYEFLFRKGIYQFSTSAVDKLLAAATGAPVMNMYSHLSDSVAHQKWSQNFDGRVVKMHHRISDVRFEISDVREDEFKTFYRYLLGYIIQSTAIIPKVPLVTSSGKTGIKKLRKLREQDPELYNLKRYGSKNDYSIRCQNPRQPAIYTDDEVASMTKAELAKLTKYWNFTLNRPAYYGCPSSDYQHLSFITGVHPKHYCLPCCNKRQKSEEDTRKGKIIADCLSKHTGDELDNFNSRHIMSYGKDLTPGRISRAHNSVNNLFLTITKDLYIYGVNANSAFFHSICAALDEKPENVLTKIINFYTEQPRVFYTSLNGKIAESFPTVGDLAIAMRNSINSTFAADLDYAGWNEFFAEAFYLVFDVLSFIFIDEGKVSLHVTNTIRNELRYLGATDSELPRIKVVLLMKQANRINPIFVVDPIAYSRRGDVSERVFSWSSPVGITVRDVIQQGADQTPSHLTLSMVKSKVTVVKKYVNRHNLCYGVLDDSGVYIPVAYSSHTDDNIPIDFEFKPPITTVDKLNAVSNKLGVKTGNTYSTGGYNLVELNGGLTPVEGNSPGLPYFDYVDVNARILSRAPPVNDRRSQLLHKSLYTTHLYDLFVLQFVSHLANERNETLRKSIEEILWLGFKKTKAKLSAILKDWPDDYITILGFVSEYYFSHFDKKQLLAQIDLQSYDFDQTTITSLKSMPRDQMLADVYRIMSSICVEADVDSDNIKLENVFEPCIGSKNKNTGAFCKDTRLIVNTSIEKLCDILVSDLRDPLRSKYLLDSIWKDTVINYFDFSKQPMEVINIYKLTV